MMMPKKKKVTHQGSPLSNALQAILPVCFSVQTRLKVGEPVGIQPLHIFLRYFHEQAILPVSHILVRIFFNSKQYPIIPADKNKINKYKNHDKYISANCVLIYIISYLIINLYKDMPYKKHKQIHNFFVMHNYEYNISI